MKVCRNVLVFFGFHRAIPFSSVSSRPCSSSLNKIIPGFLVPRRPLHTLPFLTQAQHQKKKKLTRRTVPKRFHQPLSVLDPPTATFQSTASTLPPSFLPSFLPSSLSPPFCSLSFQLVDLSLSDGRRQVYRSSSGRQLFSCNRVSPCFKLELSLFSLQIRRELPR